MISVSGAASSLPDTVARIKSSVVGVGTMMPMRGPGADFQGTGFVVGDGHYVVTNSHVVQDELDYEKRETVAIFTRVGKKVRGRRAKVVKRDRRHDLCLLRFEGDRIAPMKLGRTRDVREGELHALTGFPLGMVLGLHAVTHQGIVSAITPIVIPQTSLDRLKPKVMKQITSPYDVFQMDAIAYPGNSGSPLYEPDTGRVVGVVNSVFVKGSKEAAISHPSGITYAIPVRYVYRMLKAAGVKP